MKTLKTFDSFLNEKLGDGYSDTCDCGHKTTSGNMTFDVEDTHDRGGKVIARYTCKNCGKYHKIRTTISPFQSGY